MKNITIEVSRLLSMLQPMMGVIDKKHLVPVMSNVLMEASDNRFVLTASDGDIEYVSTSDLPCSDSDILLTLPARKLLDICRSLPVDAILTLSIREGGVSLLAAQARYKLSTLPADQFPRIQIEQTADKYYVLAANFSQLLQQTAFAMASQDVRFFLNGLLLNISGTGLTAVATDGHRLAIARVTFSERQDVQETSMILPRKAVIELGRLLADLGEADITLTATESHLSISSVSQRVIVKRIVGKYPNYQKVIPDNHPYRLTFNNNDMREAIGRVVILANEKYRGITVKVSEGHLVLDAINQEQEYAMVEIDTFTADQDILFSVNASYLLDVLNVLPEGQVIVRYHTPEHSLLLTAETCSDVRYVIMPMKI